MSKIVTLKDIAKKANVSTNTVSRALRNLPGVNVDTKETIRNIAKDLGYIIAKEKQQVAIVLSSFALSQTSFFGKIVNSIIEEYPYYEIIEITHAINRSNKLPTKLIKNNYAGTFIISHFNEALMKQINQHQEKIILIDHPSKHFHTINSNNHQGGQRATEYLIEHRHKKIGFIGDVSFSPNYKNRYHGFLDTLNNHNLKTHDQFLITDIKESQIRIFEALNDLDELPSAWFCVNSGLAFMLNTYLLSIGKRVPEDVSIICYDDTEFTRTSIPHLTSISNDLNFMGKLSTKVIDNYDVLKELIDIRITPTLKEKDSVSEYKNNNTKI